MAANPAGATARRNKKMSQTPKLTQKARNRSQRSLPASMADRRPFGRAAEPDPRVDGTCAGIREFVPGVLGSYFCTAPPDIA